MLNLILLVAIIGFVLWLVVTYIPMPDPIKTVLVVIVAIAILIYALRALGFGGL